MRSHLRHGGVLGWLAGVLLAGAVYAGQPAISPPPDQATATGRAAPATAPATSPAASAPAAADPAVVPAPATTAGTAVWVATYRLREGERERRFVLARNDDRLEYRIDGDPVRVWERGADGLRHREVFVEQGQMVSYQRGDLLALGRTVAWTPLAAVVDPSLRERLQPAGTGALPARFAAAGGRVDRYRGDLDGIAITLDWLDGAMLPARYRSGRGADRVELALLDLQRQPAGQAFTATNGLRELEFADLGDMPNDDFARRYLQHGAAPQDPASERTPARGTVLPGVAAPVAPLRAGGESPATRHAHTHH